MGNEISARQAKLWLESGREALRRAIAVAGGQENFAGKLDIRQSLVSYWLTKSKFGAAAEYCPRIELLFGIPREELRPDLYLAFRSPRVAQPEKVAAR